MIEFGITHGFTQIDDKLHVEGRCVTDLRLGDRFTKFIPYRKVGDEGNSGPKYVSDEARVVDLTVVSIFSYGKSMDFLSVGMTAKLILQGAGDNVGVFGSLCG